MLLSVLVPCLASRDWRRVVNLLSAQASAFPGEVEVLHLVDGGESPSGAKRRELSRSAKGDYLAFVDDDDTLSREYVPSLVDACRQCPDVVTFLLRKFAARNWGHEDGRVYPRTPSFPRPKQSLKPGRWSAETWRFGLWPDRGRGGRMTANHLCAWRRDHALRVPWCPHLGFGDDQLWYGPLHALGPYREVHVERVLYYYLFDATVTANQSLPWETYAKSYAEGGLRCLRNASGEVAVEVGVPERVEVPGMVHVYRADGSLEHVSLEEWECFHTTRLA